jgi:hypothetical protein
MMVTEVSVNTKDVSGRKLDRDNSESKTQKVRENKEVRGQYCGAGSSFFSSS